MKKVSIRPLSLAKRAAIAKHRAERQISASRKKGGHAIREAEQRIYATENDFDVDPVEFARAYSPFRSDVEVLLDADEQSRFRKILCGYLSGQIDHEVWRLALYALNTVRRASILPSPGAYWVRRSVTPAD